MVDQFIKGKWYKTNYGSYVKYFKTEGVTFITSEDINFEDRKYHFGRENYGSILDKTFTLLTDLSEIQQYLPKGHPDKFNNIIELW
jgi:hypothetical protein